MRIKLYRRLSRQQSTEMERHFLDYKEQMKFKNVADFAQIYEIHDRLGSGTYGTVYSGLHIRSQMPCAIKIMDKHDQISSWVTTKHELEIVEEISHPHIVRIYELMEDDENYYIIMELMKGGDLWSKIVKANNPFKPFTEAKAANIIHQILLALNYMHGLNIMHRDLKPDNVLCEDFSDLGQDEIQIKLTDFGLSAKFEPGVKQDDKFGAVFKYWAPELGRRQPYDSKVDVWGVGIIAYMLLTLKYPFYEHQDFKVANRSARSQLRNHIETGHPEYNRYMKDATP